MGPGPVLDYVYFTGYCSFWAKKKKSADIPQVASEMRGSRIYLEEGGTRF